MTSDYINMPKPEPFHHHKGTTEAWEATSSIAVCFLFALIFLCLACRRKQVLKIFRVLCRPLGVDCAENERTVITYG